jgi:hypothetical protein
MPHNCSDRFRQFIINRDLWLLLIDFTDDTTFLDVNLVDGVILLNFDLSKSRLLDFGDFILKGIESRKLIDTLSFNLFDCWYSSWKS